MKRLPLAALLLLPLGACSTAASGGADEDGGPPTLLPNGDGGTCAQVKVDISKQTPTVALVVDQSYSMSYGFGSTTRWASLFDTLMNPATGAVANLQGSVRFGLNLFTSGSPCPYMTNVAPALDNYNTINGVYGSAAPLGNTPTGPAIQSATQQILQVTAPGPKFIILATDGQPNSCDGTTDGRPAAIAAAKAAYQAGVKLFIVGVSADIAGSHLQDMANAGAGVAPGGANAPYWQAYDPQGVVDAFNTIIGGVRSCAFTLQGRVPAFAADRGIVTVDGRAMTYGRDWTVDGDGRTLELLGATCDSLKAGNSHTITAEFPCALVIP